MIFRQLFDKETSTYTYLLADENTNEGVVIDPVKEHLERDLKIIKELGIKLRYALETHVHADHITASSDLREKTGAQLVVSGASGVKGADIYVDDGEALRFGQKTLNVLCTPGHTNACASFLVEGMVFTGDTLLIRGTGRTDFQEGSTEELFNSITEKLFTLPDETDVYPGHDYNGNTKSTIKEEKKYNPRINRETTREEFEKIMSEVKLALPKKIYEAVPANLICGNIELKDKL